LAQSNDSAEGKVLADLLKAQATTEGTKVLVNMLETMDAGYACCLSSDGDLLSQWAMYADDGRGVAIGFKPDSLSEACSQMPKRSGESIRLVGVDYVTASEQSANLKKILDDAALIGQMQRQLAKPSPTDPSEYVSYRMGQQGAGKAFGAWMNQWQKIFACVFTTKLRGFVSESESRILLQRRASDMDGCGYFVRRDQLVPYLSFPIDVGEGGLVASVVLGPKNKTPTHVINGLLRQHGFTNVDVRSSELTYR
jgi:hypothetical protein